MRSAAARARIALLKYREELELVHAQLVQAHAAHLAEIDQILTEIGADIAGMPKLPIRSLILSAVQTAPQRGRTRAQIITFLEQHFGMTVKKSTVTVYLNRLKHQGFIEFFNGYWIPT
jgi:hypothetical protein